MTSCHTMSDYATLIQLTYPSYALYEEAEVTDSNDNIIHNGVVGGFAIYKSPLLEFYRDRWQ